MPGFGARITTPRAAFASVLNTAKFGGGAVQSQPGVPGRPGYWNAWRAICNHKSCGRAHVHTRMLLSTTERQH